MKFNVICSFNAIFPIDRPPKQLTSDKLKVKQNVLKVTSSLLLNLKVVITTVMWSIYYVHDFQCLFVNTEASMSDLRQGNIAIIYDVSYYE